jgi:hypothetical protein
MTFIPSVLTKDDPNNSFVATGISITSNNPKVLIPTNTTGYNTIILSIQSTLSVIIQIFFQDNTEIPIMIYSDTYSANTLYIKNFTITKKIYQIKIIFATNAIINDTFNMISRLSTELDSSISYNPSTFNFSEEFALDAFGKLRVTNPVTLLDIKFPGQTNGTYNYLQNTLMVCSVSSDNNVNFNATASNSRLLITGTGSGYYISQSRKFCTYQPGKSLLFMASGIICPCANFDISVPEPVSGYKGRIGYYSNNFTPATIPNENLINPHNGLYFEYDTTINPSFISINIANNGSITQYPQSEWNLDKMNGYGPSGLNLDFTKTQLFVMDMEWLGVGRVRFGFYAYGKIQYCHQILNLNSIKDPYTGNINLPIRYELIGTNLNQITPAYIKQICSTVISEGGYNPIGKPFSIISGAKLIRTIDNETPVLIIRPSMNTVSGSNNNYHTNIIPNLITIASDQNNNLSLLTVRLYQAEYTSTIGTISNWNDVNLSFSAVQYATSVDTFSTNNSIILDYKYFYGNLSSSINDLTNIFSDQILHLTTNIQGQSDYLVISITNLSGSNPNYYVSLNWTEIN